MNFDSRTFRKAMGCFPTGVTVVTTLGGDGAPVGVTVSSFSSLSLDPPLVLFCLDNRAGSFEAFKNSKHFAIHVLRQEQRELSITFASKLDDKWKNVTFETNDEGVPLLGNCMAVFECKTHSLVPGGDHHIVIGEVQRLNFSEVGEALVYFRGSYETSGQSAL